jgi:hypothetical protein
VPADFGHQPAPASSLSRTLERADWPETRIARGDLATEIAELKREPGKDMIAWGGAVFAQSLTGLALIDQPVALAGGLPLFKGLTAPVSPRRFSNVYSE